MFLLSKLGQSFIYGLFRLRPTYFLLLSALLISSVKADDSLMLSHIDLTVHKHFHGPLASEIQFEFFSTRTDKVLNKLKQWEYIRAEKIADDRLLISMQAFPEYQGETHAQHSKESWVIDLEEKSTRQFIAEYKEAMSDSKSLNHITEFVSTYIEDTTYIHGFNIASTVASQKSGDCTEFATLTTALSRALGLPARLVLGVVIVETDKLPNAFGHAWTEVMKDGKWQIIDAALFNYHMGKRFYLPTGALENEGIGYAMSLAENIGNLPHQLSQLKNK